MDKKRIQPTDFDNAEDYIKAKTSRKGCPTKRNPTVTLRDIFKESDCKMEFKDWKKLICLLHKAMRELIVKGHNIPIPFFGTLEYAERQSGVKHRVTKDGQTKFLNDYRMMNYNQLLRNQFQEAKGDDSGQAYKKNGKFVWINLKQNVHPRRFHFYAMKYMLRELENNLYGTNYIILRLAY